MTDQTDPPVGLLPAPPQGDMPTDYDWAHRIAYLRLLDADADGADWREVARIVLGLSPADAKAKAIWAAHLARAQWMARQDYRTWLCGTRDPFLRPLE